jgi:hypothetical protein
MTNLPVTYFNDNLRIPDPATGELVDLALLLEHASDRQKLEVFECLEAMRKAIAAAKHLCAGALRKQYGFGTSEGAGYRFEVKQGSNWRKVDTTDTLRAMVAEGTILQADMDRCLPAAPTPSPKQLDALVRRLTKMDPVAAQRLADCCTVSDPVLYGVRPVASDASAVLAEATESL